MRYRFVSRRDFYHAAVFCASKIQVNKSANFGGLPLQIREVKMAVCFELLFARCMPNEP